MEGGNTTSEKGYSKEEACPICRYLLGEPCALCLADGRDDNACMQSCYWKV